MRSTLIEYYLEMISDEREVTPDAKREGLRIINRVLGTAYEIQDFNSWLAKRRSAPVKAKDFMRREIIFYLYGKKEGLKLSTILELE